jgi:hypothetical protein
VAVAVGRVSPGEHQPGPELRLPAAAHALGDQRPLVFRHRPPDLQQELVVGILTHGAVEELHLAAVPLQFLQQQDLVHVVAGQAIRRGDQYPVHARQGNLIAEPVQPRAFQAGPTITVVAKDVLGGQLPALALDIGLQPLQLLLDR